MANIAALIVAAGSGERAGGGVPKQYRRLAGKPLLRRTADVFARFPGLSPIQVVIGSGQAGTGRLRRWRASPTCRPSPAARRDRNRSATGWRRLRAQAPEFVLIQDAARPFGSHALIERLISALESGADCAIPLLAGRRYFETGTRSPAFGPRYRATD